MPETHAATPSLLLVLLACLVAHPAHAQVKPLKGWRQMRSANFYLIGDVGEGDLRRVAGRLEQFRAAVGMILPKATMTAATPTTVMVFRSNRNYEPFKPLYNGKVRGRHRRLLSRRARGQLHHADHREAAATERGRALRDHLPRARAPDGQQHGARSAGLVQRRTGRILPNARRWPAAASRSSSAAFTRHTCCCCASSSCPLTSSSPSITSSPLYNEGAKASIFYAESWALVHYLLLGEKQKYAREGRTRCWTRWSSDLPFAEACPAGAGYFGRAAAERAEGVRLSASHSRCIQVDVRRAAGGGRTAADARPLSDADAHATAGALLLRMDRAR